MNSYDTRRNHLVSIVVGAAVALAALLGSAAQADAQPIKESTIKSECKAAGGTYTTHVDQNGNRSSVCKYKDIGGGTHYDVYENGENVASD